MGARCCQGICVYGRWLRFVGALRCCAQRSCHEQPPARSQGWACWHMWPTPVPTRTAKVCVLGFTQPIHLWGPKGGWVGHLPQRTTASVRWGRWAARCLLGGCLRAHRFGEPSSSRCVARQFCSWRKPPPLLSRSGKREKGIGGSAPPKRPGGVTRPSLG